MQPPPLRTVHVDGLTVRVHTSVGPDDAADRTPYLLVHGLGMTHRYLDRLRSELSADAAVVALDLPGHGRQRAPQDHLGIQEHAALVIEAARALGIRSCTLVAHSMGAQVITEVALQAPELAERLVLLGPAADRARRTVVQQASDLAVDSLQESPCANWTVLSDYLRTGVPWYLGQLRTMLGYALERSIEDVRCPVLVVRGSRDVLARSSWCRELTERARDGSLVEIDGEPHVVQHHAAPEVAAEIIGFRERTPGPRAAAATESSVELSGRLEDDGR